MSITEICTDYTEVRYCTCTGTRPTKLKKKHLTDTTDIYIVMKGIPAKLSAVQTMQG